MNFKTFKLFLSSNSSNKIFQKYEGKYLKEGLKTCKMLIYFVLSI